MKKSDWKYILLILAISVLVMLPKIVTNYQINDDTQFHIANILATEKTLDDWIPDDILPDVAGDYGYATRQFYPVLPHTVAAYTMKITNLSVDNTLKLVHTVVLILSGITMYFLGKRYLKKDYLAFVAALIYILFPYHLNDIYLRDSLAECFLFIFIPLILNALTYLFEDKKKFLLLFCIGYIGGMLSHLTVMVYFTFLIIPFFIINYKKVFKKKTIITLVEAAIIILGVTAPTIINMVQNKFFGDYMVFVPGVMAQGIQHSGLWLDFINYFGIFNSFLYNGNLGKFYLDIITIILIIIVIVKRRQINFKNYKFIIIFGLISLFMSSIIFPWDLLPVSMRIIQFPWRLEIFVGIAIALVAPLAIDKIKVNYKVISVGMIVLALLFNTSSTRGVLNLNDLDYELGMGWQHEYLPENAYNNWDTLKEKTYEIDVTNGDYEIISDKLTNLDFKVTEDTDVVLPRIYYLGYYLVDENSNYISIKESDLGLIEASVKAGEYKLVYKGTLAVRIAKGVSLATIIICIICLIKVRGKKNEKIV